MAAESTAVARAADRLPEHMRAVVEENRIRNRMMVEIRGTQWGKDLTPRACAAVAEYCRANRLDAARHVEILGGRIYLTAELYRDRLSPLFKDGTLRLLPTEFIHADARLDQIFEQYAGSTEPEEKEMASWALRESLKRTKLRIENGVPEAATGAAIVRIEVVGRDMIIEGVNWCGGGIRIKTRRDGTKYNDDPVGELEPTKTAESRAFRRAGIKIAEVIPRQVEDLTRLHQSAQHVDVELVPAEPIATRPSATPLADPSGDYGIPPEPPVIVPVGEPESPYRESEGEAS